MTDAPARKPQLRTWLLGLGVALVLLALVLWLVLRGGDDSGDTAATTGGSQSQSPVPSTTIGADGSPLPSKSPGQTEPTEVVTPSKQPKPVRTSLQSPAELGGGLTAEVTKIEAVQGVAHGPGESEGPSLRFSITVTNDSDKTLSTVASVLTAYYGSDATPAIDLSGPGVRRLPDEIAVGKTGTGVYVFRIPPAERDQLRLDFSYNNALPTAIFTGSA